ncbi:MAG: O-methyltransferase [Nitrososphaera sp.]
MNRRIWRVISGLDRESNLQRTRKARLSYDREMLAITADTGMFFSILIQATKATRILEIGTSSGFSTLWFADAVLSVLQNKSRSASSIITIEANPEKVHWASKNFEDAGVDKMIKIIQGQALRSLHRLRKTEVVFDFAFIDADKENMIEYFDLVLPMVRVGGIIAADNILYPEHFRPHMTRYVRHVRKQRNAQSVTVPIGNGEEVSIKLADKIDPVFPYSRATSVSLRALDSSSS